MGLLFSSFKCIGANKNLTFAFELSSKPLEEDI
jgi:hypothetical protein